MIRIAMLITALLLACGPLAYAQTTVPPATDDTGGALPPPAGTTPGVAEGAGPDAEATATDQLISQLTDEQVQELIRQARPILLQREREAAGREIEDGILLFDPEKIDAALKHLADSKADTPDDNIQRITKAMAMVDARLADPLAKLTARKFEDAAKAVEQLINPTGTGYLDAVKRMIHADALRLAGEHEKAIEAYRDVLTTMPDKVSFAAMAALRAAETYENQHRMINAVYLYEWWLANYSFLDPDRADRLTKTIEKVRADYADPLGTIVKKMDNVEKRLGEADSGKQTQVTEEEIVAILDDLIATAEENSGGGGGGGGGQAGAGQQPGGQTGQNNPTNPANVSALRGGDNAPAPKGLASARPTGGGDAWGKLPIRKREQLVELFKQRYPERHVEMLEAYYRKLAGSR